MYTPAMQQQTAVAQQGHQQEELSSLLQTNSILIDNKRMLYLSKVKAYDRQIDKYYALLGQRGQGRECREWDDEWEEGEENQQEWDGEEEERQVRNKIALVKNKREELVRKLDKIEAMRRDIEKLQHQSGHSIGIFDSSTKKLSRQKSKSLYADSQLIITNKQNCRQSSRNQRVSSAQKSGKKPSRHHNNPQGDMNNTQRYVLRNINNNKDESNQSAHKQKFRKKGSFNMTIPVSISRSRERLDYSRAEYNCNQYEQEWPASSSANKHNQQQGYHNMVSELEELRQKINASQNKLKEQQSRYRQLADQIIELSSHRDQITGEMSTLQQSHRGTLRQIHDDILKIYAELEGESAADLRRAEVGHPADKNNKKSAQLSSEGLSNKIVKLYGAVRGSCQTKKNSVFELKQTILKLEFEVSELKSQQSASRKTNQELQQKMEEINSYLQQKHLVKLTATKQQQKLTRTVEQLKAEAEQYGNLVSVKKKCYEDVENKYDNLKAKKTKLEKHCKQLEAQVSRMGKDSQKLEGNIEKMLRKLDQVKEQVVKELKSKDTTIAEIQSLESQFEKKQSQLRIVQTTITSKSQGLVALDKKLVETNQKVSKLKLEQLRLNQTMADLQSKHADLAHNITEKERQLKKSSAQLTDFQRKLSEKSAQMQQLDKKVTEKSAHLAQITEQASKIEARLQTTRDELQKVQKANKQLQQALNEILYKKQQALRIVSANYQEIEQLELTIDQKMQEITSQEQIKDAQVAQIDGMNKQIEATLQNKVKLLDLVREAQSSLTSLLSEIEQYREDEQKILDRLQVLKQLHSRLLLETCLTCYSTQPQSQRKQLSALVSAEVKQQIDSLLVEIGQAGEYKQKYQEAKKEIRKLRLDNERLNKMQEIEHEISNSLIF